MVVFWVGLVLEWVALGWSSWVFCDVLLFPLPGWGHINASLIALEDHP
jgi:hypothetical protein